MFYISFFKELIWILSSDVGNDSKGLEKVTNIYWDNTLNFESKYTIR